MVIWPYRDEELAIDMHNLQISGACQIARACLANETHQPYSHVGGNHALAIRCSIEKIHPQIGNNTNAESHIEKAKKRVSRTSVIETDISMNDISRIANYANVHANTEEITKLANDVLTKLNMLASGINCTLTTSQRTITDISEAMHVKLSEKAPHKKHVQYISNSIHQFALGYKQENGAASPQTSNLLISLDTEKEMAWVEIRTKINDSESNYNSNQCILIFNAKPKISAKIVAHRFARSTAKNESKEEDLKKMADLADLLPSVEESSLSKRIKDSLNKINSTSPEISMDDKFQAGWHPTMFYFKRIFPSYRYFTESALPEKTVDDFSEDDYVHCLSGLLFDMRRVHHSFACLRGVAAALMRELIQGASPASQTSKISPNLIEQFLDDKVESIYKVYYPNNDVSDVHNEVKKLIILSDIVSELFVRRITTMRAQAGANGKNITEDTVQQLKNLVFEGTGIETVDFKNSEEDFDKIGHLLAVHFFMELSNKTTSSVQFPHLSDAHKAVRCISSGHQMIVHFTLDAKSLGHVDLRSIMRPKEHFWMEKYNLYDEHPEIMDKTMYKMRDWIAVQYKKQQRYKFVVHKSYTHLVGASAL